MLSYPITGVREGTLQAERDGLYWNVSAVCSRDWNFPIRLIAEADGVRTVPGVPQPGPDGLRLQTRLSNRSCRSLSQSQNPHQRNRNCSRSSRKSPLSVFRSFPS